MDSPSTSDAFPGFDNLFKIQDPLANPPFRGKLLIEKPPRLLRGELSPSGPVRVERAMGGQVRDLIWTTWAGVFLISERVRELLANAEITGWKTYPVQVIDRFGSSILGYHGFAVTGRCGAFDPGKSQMMIKPPPVPQGRPAPYRRGLYFDPASWDGSDVFCSEDGSTTVVVTDRVEKLLRQSRVTNLRLKKLVDVERRM